MMVVPSWSCITCIVTGNKPKTYEIKQARWFKDRKNNELL